MEAECFRTIFVHENVPPRFRKAFLPGQLLYRQGGIAVRSNPQFGLGQLLLSRARKSRCRVYDRNMADVILLPIFSSEKANPIRCAVEGKVIDSINVTKQLVHRYLIASSRSMWPFDVCPSTFGKDSPVAGAMHVGADGGPTSKWKLISQGWYASPRRYISVPPVLAVVDSRFPVRIGERNTLVSMMFSTENHANRYEAMTIRWLLRRECIHQPSHVCRFVNVKGATAESRNVSMKLYQSSTFCAIPPGDWPSRIPALGDAILMGCIPVLFDRAQLELWPVHWTWEGTSVYVPHPRGVIGQLQNISVSSIKAMQDRLRLRARQLLYEDDELPGAWHSLLSLFPKLHGPDISGSDPARSATPYPD